jgi:hypothetical protein
MKEGTVTAYKEGARPRKSEIFDFCILHECGANNTLDDWRKEMVWNIEAMKRQDKQRI